MLPMQERIVNGGRNFDFKLVDESTATTNRIQLFPDIQASLKSALALRFAEKDYFEKVNVRMVEAGMPFKEEVNTREKLRFLKQFSDDFPPIKIERASPEMPEGIDSETVSSRGSEKSNDIVLDSSFYAASKAIHAFRDVEQKMILSSRMGIKKTTDNIFRPKMDNQVQVVRTEICAPPSVQSDVSCISTSNLSADSSTPVNPPLQEKTSANFESQELQNIVEKHLHLLKSKSINKKKRILKKKNLHEVSFLIITF